MNQDANAQLVNLEVGPTYPDTIQDLQLIGAVQPPTQITRLRFRRAYDTRDRADVSIELVKLTSRNNSIK